MSISETGDIAQVREPGRPHAAAGPSGLAWLPLGFAVIALDQLVKWLIVSHLTPGQPVPVLPPVLDFNLMYNTGAAFSFLDLGPGWQSVLCTAGALAVSAWIVVELRTLKWRGQGLLAVSGALALGGALGNVADRMRLGRVVDFIDAHWQGHHFWAFNVADSAITVGAVIYLALQLVPVFAGLRAGRAP